MRAHSLNEHRLKQNPLEKRLLAKWNEQDKHGHNLEYMLSGALNCRQPVSERDTTVAATVVQWLGSPVGQAFLEDALGIDTLRQQVDTLFNSKE